MGHSPVPASRPSSKPEQTKSVVSNSETVSTGAEYQMQICSISRETSPIQTHCTAYGQQRCLGTA